MSSKVALHAMRLIGLVIIAGGAMKKRSLVAAAIIGVMFLLAFGLMAKAAELKVLSAFGMQAVVEDLGPKFERETGHRLAITFATLGTTVKRVHGGENFDIVIALQRGIDGFVKDGKTVAGNVTVLARTGMGVAVRTGAPKPDISSPEAFKRTLLAARSITYTNPATGGASGIHFAKVLDRLGIANEMKPKTVFLPRAGPVGALVANGEAEIVVQPFQLLIAVPGIDIIGPLPGDLQETEVFVAAIMSGAKETTAAKALIEFLRAPQSGSVIKAKGMQPN